MKKILFAIAVALICAVSSEAKDWAGFGVFEKANESVKDSPDIVFMGNSITEVWAKVDSAFFAEHNFVGRGISGQTSCEMLVRFRRDVIDLKPRVVLILAGINDIAENNGVIKLENVLGNIMSMCELAKVNGIRPVLCSVLPCNHLFWRKELKPAGKVKELNGMIIDYAQAEGLTYVDYYTPMAMPDGSLNPEYTDDGCHPTLPGYKVMEDTLLARLKEAGILLE